MSDISQKVKETFFITCRSCGSSEVVIDFYAGFVHDSGADCGNLSIVCLSCLAEVDGDDF